MQNPPLLALVQSASFMRAQAQGLGCCHERFWPLMQQQRRSFWVGLLVLSRLQNKASALVCVL